MEPKAKRSKTTTPPRPEELSEEDAARHQAACFVAPIEAIEAAATAGNWGSVAALNRINALTCCKSAEHGWPGGSFSCCELLLALHLRCPDAAEVILSKGHAAAMQYATLFAAKELTATGLTEYKLGAGHPEAHADMICDTGSLGQAVSTAAGMAAAVPSERIAVVMGDGEMQEGQCYEALMTIRHKNITNVTIFIDINGYQSDNPCDDVMAIHSLAGVVSGFGFDAIEIDGHDSDAVVKAWEEAAGKHVVILAKTTKGGGTKHMPATVHPVTKMKWQPWHTKIPSWEQYITIIEEQLAIAESPPLAVEAWKAHRSDAAKLDDAAVASLPNTHRPGQSKEGTGKAFGERLVAAMATSPKLTLVCADLAGSCGINGAVGHERYHEVGVAEQDGVSFAAGLALKGGMLPIFSTYSNFMKRCFENIFINLAEGARCHYAGHYSGLCYHTDGKSHQSINDASIFQGMPGMVVVDPVSADHARRCADWAISEECTQSVYFRLRRTPCLPLEAAFDPVAKGAHPIDDLVTIPATGSSHRGLLLVAMGTQAVKLAWECQSTWASGADVVVVPSLNAGADAVEQWKRVLVRPRPADTEEATGAGLPPVQVIFTIEDDAGALKSQVSKAVAQLGGQTAFDGIPFPRLVSKTVNAVGPSFRDLPSCLDHFGFTTGAIQEQLEKAMEI